MKNISIWKDTARKLVLPKLDSEKEVDVLIIGGGITGASTYYHLKNSKLKVMLVEANTIGMAITANSTGKLSFLQNDLLDKIRTCFDDEVAKNYLNSQIDAINLVANIIKNEKINCDLVKVKSRLYTNKESEIEDIKDLEQFLMQNNIKVTKTKANLVESKYEISVDNTYMFHPIKFVNGLLKNQENIYEDTRIIKIEEHGNYYYCYTNKYLIKTKWVVIASHYPYFNLPFFFPLKTSIEKSYLSASKYEGERISLISYSNPFISIRTYKDYLIYLSNSHSINKDIGDKHNFNELLKKVNDLKLNPDYLWSNSDVMSNDGLPYIGELKDKLLIGSAYNTWGLANGVLAGKILSDIILNRKNKYISLFAPNRINIDQIIGGVSSAFKSAGGYINGMKKDEVVKYDGKTMIYKDNKVLRKCPHMGCKLKLNEQEETWDCPCHGSRFALDGKCINAPANKDITINQDDL